MKPGDVCLWWGKELFSSKQMYFCDVINMPKGGSALIITLDSFDMLGEKGTITQKMAFILVKGTIGWAPLNWLEKQ